MNAPAADWPTWLDAPLARGLGLRAHALLVHAPGALGQFELALALARGWLCEDPREGGHACGRCASCRLMDARAHPDLHVLVPDALRASLMPADAGDADAEGEGDSEGEGGGKSRKKPSREIQVKGMRSAIDWSHATPTRNRAKVLVVHPAEAMNAVTANALLKTLEEPPGRLRIVLTADEADALLPTVRSRCQRLPIAPPPEAVALAWLDAQGMPDAAVLLAAAGGRPHAARALHAEGVDAAAWSAVPQMVRRGQAQSLSAWPVVRVVSALQCLCHDLLASRAGAAARFFTAAALAPALKPEPPTWSALLTWQRSLLQAARHDEHPWNAPLRIEALVLEAAALWQTPRATAPGGSGPLATLPGR